jgi:hypothetical protein
MKLESAEPAKAGVVVRHPDDGWIVADAYPMSGYTRRALAGLTRVMCPPAPAPQLDDLEARVAAQVGIMLRYMRPIVAFGFCAAVVILDWSPLWRLASWRRVRSLDAARAARILGEIGTSKLPGMRLLMLGVRGLILSVYFDQDEVHRAIHYAPVPFIEQRIALRKRILRGEATRPADLIAHRPHDVTLTATEERGAA